MANNNSTQITNMTSYRDTANATGGRLRYAYFTCTVPTTGIADTMTLTKLPKGARVLGGRLQFTVAQGATATTAIGISGTTGKYFVAAVQNVTTYTEMAKNVTENYGTETTAEETIIATNAAATWTAATCYGHIAYLTD
jgi:hypothetical protein